MIPVAVIFQPRCSCSRQIGAIQQKHESQIINGMTQVQSINNFGISSMCCRSSIMNAAMYFIRSTNKGRITDEIGHIKRPSSSTLKTEHHVEDSKPFTFKLEPPSFPLLPGEVRINQLPTNFSIGTGGLVRDTVNQINVGVGGMTMPEPLQSYLNQRLPRGSGNNIESLPTATDLEVNGSTRGLGLPKANADFVSDGSVFGEMIKKATTPDRISAEGLALQGLPKKDELLRLSSDGVET
jgi:DNA-directed RNA polymerase subunit N (RpoN/RPB10)